MTPKGSEWRKQVDNNQQFYTDKELINPARPEKETLKTKIKNFKNEIFNKEDKESARNKTSLVQHSSALDEIEESKSEQTEQHQ